MPKVKKGKKFAGMQRRTKKRIKHGLPKQTRDMKALNRNTSTNKNSKQQQNQIPKNNNKKV